MFSNRRGRIWRRMDVRLTLWYSAAMVAIVLAACGFLAYRLHHNLLKQVDGVLADEALEVQAFLGHVGELENIRIFIESQLDKREYFQFYIRALDLEGEHVAGQRTAPKGVFSFGTDMTTRLGRKSLLFETNHGREPFRQVSVLVRHPSELSYWVQVSTSLKHLRNAEKNFLQNVLVLVPVALFLSTIGGWLLARKSLMPVREIAATAERISDQNLGERLSSPGTGDEIDELVGTINRMLDRIALSFQEIMKFSADASHELRTPLCAMRGEAEVLLSKERPAAEYREAVERFTEQLERMNRLTNGLLLLARLEANPRPSNGDVVDVGYLLRDLGEFFDVMAQDRGVQLDVSAGISAPVAGDRMMLQQAFSNLIDNALKYTPQGGTVALELEAAAPWVEVRIRDEGVGIPQENLPHVFERFYRVDKSRSRHTGGSGLGLSITQKIVERHGGCIGIQSVPGHGTTVTVTLPLAS